MTDPQPPNRRAISPGWVSVGVVLVSQIVAIAVIYGGLDQRVAALESRTAPLEAGALVRVEERVAAVQASVSRIERRLEHPQ